MRYQFIHDTELLYETHDKKEFLINLKKHLLEDTFEYIRNNELSDNEYWNEQKELWNYLLSENVDILFEKIKEFDCAYELRID